MADVAATPQPVMMMVRDHRTAGATATTAVRVRDHRAGEFGAPPRQNMGLGLTWSADPNDPRLHLQAGTPVSGPGPDVILDMKADNQTISQISQARIALEPEMDSMRFSVIDIQPIH